MAIYPQCDIHAADAKDFAETERDCRMLIDQAGGKVLNNYEYMGGFM